ncbi:MAG: type II toxin-antitoxin system PemK/MazF family toxin [Aquihabitans sp.]
MSGIGPLGRLKNKVNASLTARKKRAAGTSYPSKAAADDDHNGTGGIAVSYAPESDGEADPGEVVWAWVPYEDDPSQGKDRPVLVLGWDGPLLAAVQLSSKDHSERNDAHEWVPVGTGGWDREARPSSVDASRLLRLDPMAVRREGAALDRSRFDAVLARVEDLHDWHR